MGNWAELPEDLLVLTAQKIALLEDFLSFSGVCRSWRFVAVNDNFRGCEQIPWLMLSDKDKPEEHRFISQRKGGIIRTINLPEAKGKRCLETLGWLVTLAEDGEMNLLHPFTRVQINLPHGTTFKGYDLTRFYNDSVFIHKAVLSSRPEESKDYVLVVVYGWSGRLAFWRPEDKYWTDVEVNIVSFRDIIFHEGLFYGVMNWGMVFAFSVCGPRPTRPWVVLHQPYKCIQSAKQLYLVESAGVILLVARKVIQDSPQQDFGEGDPFGHDNKQKSAVKYRTCQFLVFKAVVSKQLSGEAGSLGQKGWVEITSLGNNALFLGDNASVSVDASRFPGIKASCIYYTDKYSKHTSIFCLEDGSNIPCYEEEPSNPICPPLWVNPSSF